MTLRHLRWWIVSLLFAATAISYLDRQTLAVVAPVLRDELGISNFGYARMVFAFLLAYTLLQPVTGWLVDRVGTRRGFAILMTWWSIAAMLHALGRGVLSFSVLRFLLGAGEAGSWAACVRATSEWLPSKERGLANGLWGAGTSVGLVVSVPLVAWLTLRFGWRSAFVIMGMSGLVWIGAWLYLYHPPDQHPALGADELAHIRAGAGPAVAPGTVRYLDLLRSRQVLALFSARMFADPVAWFYNAWVPEYTAPQRRLLGRRRRTLRLDSLLRTGGRHRARRRISDRLCRRGRPPVAARMTVMRAGAVLMTAGAIAAVPLPIAWAMVAISVAIFGFGLWAANMMSLCADAFPSGQAGSVTGLTGVGAGIGGMVYTLFGRLDGGSRRLRPGLRRQRADADRRRRAPLLDARSRSVLSFGRGDPLHPEQQVDLSAMVRLLLHDAPQQAFDRKRPPERRDLPFRSAGVRWRKAIFVPSWTSCISRRQSSKAGYPRAETRCREGWSSAPDP